MYMYIYARVERPATRVLVGRVFLCEIKGN